MLNGARTTPVYSTVLATIARIVVAFAFVVVLPVSQLRLVTVLVECCCPDPDHCQCPDHKPSDSPHATLEPCHRTVNTIESPGAQSFAPVVTVAELVPVRALVAAHHTYTTPHEPPTPERPSAPS
jgi:hypothetical protein